MIMISHSLSDPDLYPKLRRWSYRSVRFLRLETHRADERTRRVKSLVADLTMLGFIGGLSF